MIALLSLIYLSIYCYFALYFSPITTPPTAHKKILQILVLQYFLLSLDCIINQLLSNTYYNMYL